MQGVAGSAGPGKTHPYASLPRYTGPARPLPCPPPRPRCLRYAARCSAVQRWPMRQPIVRAIYAPYFFAFPATPKDMMERPKSRSGRCSPSSCSSVCMGMERTEISNSGALAPASALYASITCGGGGPVRSDATNAALAGVGADRSAMHCNLPAA